MRKFVNKAAKKIFLLILLPILIFYIFTFISSYRYSKLIDPTGKIRNFNDYLSEYGIPEDAYFFDGKTGKYLIVSNTKFYIEYFNFSSSEPQYIFDGKLDLIAWGSNPDDAGYEALANKNDAYKVFHSDFYASKYFDYSSSKIDIKDNIMKNISFESLIGDAIDNGDTKQ